MLAETIHIRTSLGGFVLFVFQSQAHGPKLHQWMISVSGRNTSVYTDRQETDRHWKALKTPTCCWGPAGTSADPELNCQGIQPGEHWSRGHCDTTHPSKGQTLQPLRSWSPLPPSPGSRRCHCQRASPAPAALFPLHVYPAELRDPLPEQGSLSPTSRADHPLRRA